MTNSEGVNKCFVSLFVAFVCHNCISSPKNWIQAAYCCTFQENNYLKAAYICVLGMLTKFALRRPAPLPLIIDVKGAHRLA